ncbi:MAG: M28 family peptidase [Bryobacteraceae bacterium]|nr:M28 family peptidase [Bryobacteraceae bacterium]
MRRQLSVLVLAVAATASAEEILGERIRAHTKFLSSDDLEGRGVGVRGERIATDYLAAQLALMGIKPAGDQGTYFQRVPLVGVTTQPDAQLTATGQGGRRVEFQWLQDFVGTNYQQQPKAVFDGDVIFVGHGITAPEFGWDDYKGVDVKGKVVALFTNEPPSDDPKFFGGKALTYYGRWTYKYENAARHGAAAVLILHTTPTAGYGWDVVKSSWGREDTQVKLPAGQPGLALAGWLSQEASQKFASLAGRKAEDLLAAAGQRGFQAFPLGGARVAGNITSKIRTIDSRNVIGRVEGSDPKLKEEVVVFSAHWDHLGVGAPVAGDAIYNGAVDNATGCAMVLEIGRAWASLQTRPRRSALFLFVTAEEGGLRGSQYYGTAPVVPAARTALNLNYDAFYPFGKTADVVVTGAERTTVWPTVQEVAKQFQLSIKPDPRPEQGLFYRSDHFSLAKAGIPAFSIKGGNEFLGKPADFGTRFFQEYNAKNYHQPSDEYREDWDFAGMEQMARFGFTLGMRIANDPKMPAWLPGDEFARK